MTIIKVKTKVIGQEKGTRHVGVPLPENLSTFLTLYNLTHGISKSAIIIKLIRGWIVSLKEDGINEDTLIADMVEQLLTAWKKKKAKDRYATIKSFKTQMITELEWKGFPLEVIRKILTGFNDGTK